MGTALYADLCSRAAASNLQHRQASQTSIPCASLGRLSRQKQRLKIILRLKVALLQMLTTKGFSLVSSTQRAAQQIFWLHLYATTAPDHCKLLSSTTSGIWRIGLHSIDCSPMVSEHSRVGRVYTPPAKACTCAAHVAWHSCSCRCSSTFAHIYCS